MSKKKKTLDELLEEALVQEDEQPFEIPENWKWVKIGEITDVVSGGTPKTQIKEYYEGGEIAWISPADLSGYEEKYISYGKKNITELGLAKSSAKLMPKKTVLLSTRAPIGYVVIANNELSTNQGFKSFLPNESYLPEYLYWYLKNSKGYLESMASGTTFKELSGGKAKEIGFPLAPIKEQIRIVGKIEILFAKIDKAQQLIEEAKATFELRRAAIFKEVYGDPNEIASDKWKTIGELFYVQVGSTPSRKKDEYWNGENPWLSSGEVNFNRVMDSKEKVTELAVKEARLKLAPKGSILFGMIGEGKTRGQVAILGIDSYHNQNMASIWVSETNIPTEYVYYWLVSKYTENRQNSSGNNQPAYNKTRVQALTIPIYEEAVMLEKVKILSKLEELESKVSSLIDLEQNILNIKQSVLSKAFKGELGTNDPTDEPAIELLKSILQEKL